MVTINLKEESTIEFDMVIEGNISKLESVGLCIKEELYEIKLPCKFQNQKVICTIPILDKVVSPGEKEVVLEVIVDNKIYRPFEQLIMFEKPLLIQTSLAAIHESSTAPKLSFKEIKLKKNNTSKPQTLEQKTTNNDVIVLKPNHKSKLYGLLNEAIDQNRKIMKKLENNQIDKKQAILEMHNFISNKFGKNSKIIKIWKNSEKNNNFQNSELLENRAPVMLKKLDLILNKIQKKIGYNNLL
jgi:hypothetical protein